MMPARAYQYEAEVARPWREPAPEIKEVPRRLHKPVRKQNYKLFRRRLFVSAVVILAIFGVLLLFLGLIVAFALIGIAGSMR